MNEPARAQVPPPPAKAPPRRGLMIPPPTPDAPAPAIPDNMSRPNAGLQDLNFKVDPGFHRSFKAVAHERGMPMKELLEAAFKAWIEQYGDDYVKAIVARHMD